jgi:hypothetical protein
VNFFSSIAKEEAENERSQGAEKSHAGARCVSKRSASALPLA